MKKKIKKQALGLLALVVVMAVAFAAIPSEAASKKPTKMSLKVTAKTIDIKGHATISVKSVKPSKASKAVTFKSGNKKIATVSSKGVVKGKKAGKVKITVTAKANKKLKKSVTMKVKDLKPTSISISASKGTSLSKVKAARKSFSATWKKQSKQTSGYQLQYSTNKKFAKSVKTSTISKNTTVKKTVKSLKAKKTYYVRVRTYKTVKVGKKSVKIYSGWSTAKKVKTK